jgi:hypothetical protein
MSTICIPQNQTQTPFTILSTMCQNSLLVQSPALDDLRYLWNQSKQQCRAAFTAWECVPGNVNDLNYSNLLLPQEFDEIRHLKRGWDGEHTDPPSAQTVEVAEIFWLLLNNVFDGQIVKPRIEPGTDDFIEFMWQDQYPNSMFQLWVYGDGPRCEWFFEENGKSFSGDGDLFAAFKVVVSHFA